MTPNALKLINEYSNYCDKNNITIKSVGMAQLLIESSHGTSDLYLKHNNAFGIKYTERADYPVTYTTTEYNDQGEPYTVEAQFSGFTRLDKCFNDYCHIVKPQNIHSIDEYLIVLKTIGYATDPSYIQLIKDVINDFDLATFDVGTSTSKHLVELRQLKVAYEDKIELLAHMVINGDFGNGAERKEKLGDMYSIIQDRVNEILR